MNKKPIVVVGSYNVGLFLKGQRLPQQGETVVAEFYEGAGGKGSNQAVAAPSWAARSASSAAWATTSTDATPAGSIPNWASTSSTSPRWRTSTRASASS